MYQGKNLWNISIPFISQLTFQAGTSAVFLIVIARPINKSNWTESSEGHLQM